MDTLNSSTAEVTISFYAWLRAFLLSPGVLFTLLYFLVRLLQDSYFSWLVDWAIK
jgi:hypothetical protein